MNRLSRSENTNRVEDDMQTTTDKQEAATKYLHQLSATRKQLTKVLRDLRDEESESDADDESSEDRQPPPSTLKSATRSSTPRPRRHRGHVGAPSPELDQVAALKKQLNYLRQHVTKQA